MLNRMEYTNSLQQQDFEQLVEQIETSHNSSENDNKDIYQILGEHSMKTDDPITTHRVLLENKKAITHNILTGMIVRYFSEHYGTLSPNIDMDYLISGLKIVLYKEYDERENLNMRSLRNRIEALISGSEA